jgi:hypothetical protein
LFAFVLVAGGVLMLPRIANTNTGASGKFRLPYINGQFIVPLMYALYIFLMRNHVKSAFQNIGHEGLEEVLFLAFLLLATILTIATVVKKLSLIPILGVLFCSYLLIEIPEIAWLWFFAWMGISLAIYFFFFFRKSKIVNPFTKRA